MSATNTQTAIFMIALTDEERGVLLTLLEHEDRVTLVEAHRTDSPNYREHIERRDTVLRDLIGKLRRRTTWSVPGMGE